jgi:hypothetical protein
VDMCLCVSVLCCPKHTIYEVPHCAVFSSLLPLPPS